MIDDDENESDSPSRLSHALLKHVPKEWRDEMILKIAAGKKGSEEKFLTAIEPWRKEYATRWAERLGIDPPQIEDITYDAIKYEIERIREGKIPDWSSFSAEFGRIVYRERTRLQSDLNIKARLEEPLSDEHLEIPIPEDVNPQQRFANREILDRTLNLLTPRQREVLVRRAEGETRESIGDKINRSRERVRQIEIKALRVLREKLGHSYPRRDNLLSEQLEHF